MYHHLMIKLSNVEPKQLARDVVLGAMADNDTVPRAFYTLEDYCMANAVMQQCNTANDIAAMRFYDLELERKRVAFGGRADVSLRFNSEYDVPMLKGVEAVVVSRHADSLAEQGKTRFYITPLMRDRELNEHCNTLVQSLISAELIEHHNFNAQAANELVNSLFERATYPHSTLEMEVIKSDDIFQWGESIIYYSQFIGE